MDAVDLIELHFEEKRYPDGFQKETMVTDE